MDFLPPASMRFVPQRATIGALAALVVVALVCLANTGNATAVVGLIGAILAIVWIVAATAVTHFCGGDRLVLKPPRMHADFHALSGFRVELHLGNLRRRVPALFLTARLETRTEGVPLVSPPVFLGRLDARAHAAFAWDITVRKRGEVDLLGTRVEACFPGSIAAHECRFPFACRLLALPASYRLDNRALGLLTGRRRVGGRNHVAPASIGDYVGVRDYRPGDNPRDIHLGLSVRLPEFPNQLVVREFEDPTTDDVYVVLDTFLPEAEAGSDLLRYRHEKSLSFAVAFCRLLVERRYHVRFCAVDGEVGTIDLSIARPTRDLPELEARLARLRPVADVGRVARLLDAISARGHDAIFLVGLREGAPKSRRGAVFTISPDTQAKLVREVVGA